MPAPIHWTSDDIVLFVVCRFVDEMSWNDIAAILSVRTQTAIELAERLGVFRSGEVVRGRTPAATPESLRANGNMSRPIAGSRWTRRNPTDNW